MSACDKPVQGDGLMFYHCSLDKGHEDRSRDSFDPEPCFAVESSRSVRLWKAWVKREERRATVLQSRVDCPFCDESQSMQVGESEGVCDACGATAEVQQDLGSVTHIGEQMLSTDGGMAAKTADPDRDEDIREAARRFTGPKTEPEPESEGDTVLDTRVLPGEHRAHLREIRDRLIVMAEQITDMLGDG